MICQFSGDPPRYFGNRPTCRLGVQVDCAELSGVDQGSTEDRRETADDQQPWAATADRAHEVGRIDILYLGDRNSEVLAFRYDLGAVLAVGRHEDLCNFMARFDDCACHGDPSVTVQKEIDAVHPALWA